MGQGQETTFIKDTSNTAVAQSEYDAALAAIEATFDDFNLSSSDYEGIDLDEELIREFYKAARESLLSNVKRVIQPMNDNDYSDYVDQYHVVLDESVSDDDESDCADDNNRTSQDNRDDDEEEEIDEEELVDQKALNDAKELRTRIRTMSAAVQTVRERVLKHTKGDLSSSLSKHLLDKPVQIIFQAESVDSMNENKSSSDKENEVQNNDTKISVPIEKDLVNSPTLQNSLQDLTRLLNDPQWKRLPNRIKSLQETIETIQKETAEDRVMSQTERTITTQQKDTIDESARQMILGEDSENLNSTLMNPMDRLALFGEMFA